MIFTQNNNSTNCWWSGFIVFGILFSVLFLPDIRLTSSFAARPEDIFFLFGCLYLFNMRVLYNTYYTWLMIVIGILMFMSIGLNDRLISVNSFEFYNKVIKGIIGYNIFILYMESRTGYKWVTKFLFYALCIMIALNICQLFRVPVVYHLFSLYSNQGQIEAFERRASFSLPRLTGLFGNPNTNATFFMMLSGFVLDLFLIRKNKIYLLITSFTLIILLLTQSRTMFVATLITLFVIFILTRNIILILFGLLVYLFLNIVDAQYLTLIFDADKFYSTHSVTGRINEWGDLVDMIKLQPIIGYGGYKEYFYITQTYPENEYILAMFRYGIFYLFVYLIMLLREFFIGVKALINKRFGGGFLISSSVAMMVGSCSNTPFNNSRLFIVFIFIGAYSLCGFYHNQLNNR